MSVGPHIAALESMPEAAARSAARVAPSVYLETFGCQMNELDSELVRGQLVALGYRFVEDDSRADVVLYNTCSVREHAENKAYSRIGIIGRRKRQGERIVLGVLGCMAERDGVDMLRRHPQIDLLCGPGELDRLPALIDNATRTGIADRAERDMASVVALQGNRSRRTATLAAAEDNLELLDLSRAFDPDRAPAGGCSAYVRITRGCNKFCTYCVVPRTRGAEIHRPPDHIVEECARLAEHGVIEVTLLGQTVNHYLYVHGTATVVGADGSTNEAPQIGPGLAAFRRRLDIAADARSTTFAQLLRRIHDEVPAIRRLRFVTSYPRDFGDDILETMAECPRICRYLHVPPQSGSDRILKLMNRGYTVAEYRAFLERARQRLPDACFGGDMIVGFPTETEEDFEATVSLLRAARFKNCFIFKYSPRPGTTAMERFEDDVPEPVKRARNNRLLAVQSEIGLDVHREWIGRTVDVFVEHEGERKATESELERRDGRKSGSAGPSPLGAQAGARSLRIHGQDSKCADDATDRRPVQMIGRTDGDLIVAFDLPQEAVPGDLVGRLVPVTITGASVLLLHGAASSHCPTIDDPIRTRTPNGPQDGAGRR